VSALEPRPGILDVEPYVGGEAAIAGRNRVIRLASNENPLGPSPRAKAAYVAHQEELHRYPDGGANRLRAAIAEIHGLDADRLVCGAGSDELIALLVRGYAGPGDEVLYSAHGFLMYAISARTAGAVPVAAPERDLTADVDALLARVSTRTRILFLANPNNPTGTQVSAEELRRLRERLPGHVLLAIDAAYAEYVTDPAYESGRALVETRDDVVMLRTFSKIHGLASLRLGWAYGPPRVIDVLNRVRGPFNVTMAAQEAGIAAIRDTGHVERSRAHNAAGLARFNERCAALGLEPVPSLANFALLRFPDEPGRDAAAAAAFLKERGILVRAMGGYGLPERLRVTIGTDEDMEAVVEALAAFRS
jgi:histidinol-phosphate aminotransferase